MRRLFYLPLALPLFLFLVFLAFLFPFLLGEAFRKLGLPPFVALQLLLLSLLGSAINLPVRTLKWEEEVLKIEVRGIYGFLYPVLVTGREERKTVIAVNVGGALLPLLLSFFLLLRFGSELEWRVPLSVGLVALFCWKLARPVKGVGIVMPAFLPPLFSALVALLLGGENAAPLAYLSGTLGTLVGADLMNLNKVERLGAPVVSIGGAGTFDGIFLTGIFSVLLV
ncbi:MAG: hypothetical protein DSO02_03800 [Hadesarchaea archaeon]|nr:MAG: hypothetical protein DSO03_01045 [Hadesarchaea archaeon]TDA33656.1 MAG: hypothetical protein DSO02_03800 [Hadesarchaea archaeon]